ncbi:MAG: hypothetical protein ACOCUL_01555 [Bacteroidota bacterium]
MKVPKEWADNMDLFEYVTDALSGKANEFDAKIVGSIEEDSYGDNGYIKINFNGKIYRLCLEEER